MYQNQKVDVDFMETIFYIVSRRLENSVKITFNDALIPEKSSPVILTYSFSLFCSVISANNQVTRYHKA